MLSFHKPFVASLSSSFQGFQKYEEEFDPHSMVLYAWCIKHNKNADTLLTFGGLYPVTIYMYIF